MTPDQGRAVAVVLAGGTSRRFGRDKLAEPLGAEAPTLLDAALTALPVGLEVLVVGPARPTLRRVRFLREDPPGGGPAAALVAGLRCALAEGAGTIAVLPADAPRAGAAAVQLLDRLASRLGVTAVVGVDADGREQPLQLALSASAARQLVAAAPDGGQGASARALLRSLEPPAEPVALRPDVLYDIDTPGQLAAWRARSSVPVEAVLARVAEVGMAPDRSRPVVVALTGGPGPARSTLAEALRLRTGATVLRAGDLRDGHRLPAVLAALRGLVVLDDIGGGARLDGLADLNVLVTAHQPGPAARADGPPPPDATFDLVVRASEIGDVDGA
jgi:molybdopterin-guanine dinucleotide biosynthesis protein A